MEAKKEIGGGAKIEAALAIESPRIEALSALS